MTMKQSKTESGIKYSITGIEDGGFEAAIAKVEGDIREWLQKLVRGQGLLVKFDMFPQITTVFFSEVRDLDAYWLDNIPWKRSI